MDMLISEDINVVSIGIIQTDFCARDAHNERVIQTKMKKAHGLSSTIVISPSSSETSFPHILFPEIVSD
jgi:hypothetical protein